MLVDLHTHTNEYSACSRMDSQTLMETAIERGLDGIALTEHDYLRSPEEMDHLRRRFPQIKIFNAIEVSVKEKEHVLVYGVLNPNLFYNSMPLGELEQIVKSENGIMVLAHPFRYKNEIAEDFFNSGIEGIEVASVNVKRYMKKGYDYILSRKNLIQVMGSDTHDAATVGIFTTNFKIHIRDEAELVQAIRSKEFTLCKNMAAISKLNETLSGKIPLAQELIKKNLSNQEIAEGVGGMSFSDIWALRNSEDILYD
jgi:hypothetical protein